MINNELDILNIRLYELYDVVDYFVLVESKKTHKGKEKPLHYENNKHLFEKYGDKIINVVIDFPESYGSFCGDETEENWLRESSQRECIFEGIEKIDNITEHDVIIITDVDEIPNSSVIEKIKKREIILKTDEIYSLQMRMHYYNIEWIAGRYWNHPKIINYGTCKKNVSLTQIRLSPVLNIILDGGWHLSYFGDETAVLNKTHHILENHPNECFDIKYLQECIEKGILSFSREKLIKIPLETNNNVPKYFLRKKPTRPTRTVRPTLPLTWK